MKSNQEAFFLVFLRGAHPSARKITNLQAAVSQHQIHLIRFFYYFSSSERVLERCVKVKPASRRFCRPNFLTLSTLRYVLDNTPMLHVLRFFETPCVFSLAPKIFFVHLVMPPRQTSSSWIWCTGIRTKQQILCSQVHVADKQCRTFEWRSIRTWSAHHGEDCHMLSY